MSYERYKMFAQQVDDAVKELHGLLPYDRPITGLRAEVEQHIRAIELTLTLAERSAVDIKHDGYRARAVQEFKELCEKLKRRINDNRHWLGGLEAQRQQLIGFLKFSGEHPGQLALPIDPQASLGSQLK